MIYTVPVIFTQAAKFTSYVDFTKDTQYEGDAIFGKNVEVDGNLTLNDADNLKFKDGTDLSSKIAIASTGIVINGSLDSGATTETLTRIQLGDKFYDVDYDSFVTGKTYEKDINVINTALNTLTESVNSKQDTLVSGTNIKTVNGNSLLGSGDITISGGSSTEKFPLFTGNIIMTTGSHASYSVQKVTWYDSKGNGTTINAPTTMDSSVTYAVENLSCLVAQDLSDVLINGQGCRIRFICKTSDGYFFIPLSSGEDYESGFIYFEGQCFSTDTLITCADSKKLAKDIKIGDELLVYDFYTGKQVFAPVSHLMTIKTASYYWQIELSNGTILKLIGSKGKSHRLYNIEQNKFIYPQDFACNEHTITEDNELVTIKSCTKINRPIEYLNLLTEKHYNCYLNGILGSSRISNRYEIKDMRYILSKPIMSEEDINKYYLKFK